MEYMNKSKPDILKNKTCPYCGIELDSSNISEEHVIGRKFVPKKSLENEWNLILNACISCNNNKSDLEDDISAITQVNALGSNGKYSDRASAVSKAKGSLSRRTGKKVIESIENIEIPITLGPGIDLRVSLIGEPQIDDVRANELAFMHMKGLFYLQTYDYVLKKGKFIPGVFVVISNSVASDWGNEVNTQFQNIIEGWEIRLNLITAKNNFKCNTRKKHNEECWSWALEWNEFYRIIGFWGKEIQIKRIIDTITFPNPSAVLTNTGGTIKSWQEIGLDIEKDQLFRFPDT